MKLLFIQAFDPTAGHASDVQELLIDLAGCATDTNPAVSPPTVPLANLYTQR